jgi:radical SAM superfamily enzyme YgiQ (UPF0313 family)
VKILLINPPVEDFFFTPVRAYPLGILSLATVLNIHGFKVKVLNTLEEHDKFSLAFPKDFEYLKRYYYPNKSPFHLFSHYYHFGMQYEKIVEAVRVFSPQIVGISSNFSPYFETALHVARLIKQIDKNIIIVLGGRVCSAQPEFVLQQPCIDFIIRGEAEYSLLEFCRGFARKTISNIKGLCYATTKGTHITPATFIEDLNQLPILRREFIQYKKYIFKGDISTSLLTSRGCNQRCRFCAINERFRFRRAENVFTEIKSCYALGIRHFNFEDDNINDNPEFEKILDCLIESAYKVKISFMNGLLSKGLTLRIKEKLIAAGLTHLDFSLVSSSKALRNKVRRKENTANMFSVACAFTKKQIPATVHFIIGLPHQTFSGALNDIRLLARKPVLLGPSIFYPVIESPMFKELKQEFALRENDYRYFRSSCACFDRSISRDRIFSIFYFSRLINLLKEIIDLYSLNTRNFRACLNTIAQRYPCKGNTLIVIKKIDRVSLGLILVNKLLKEHVLYRVSERREKERVCYTFFKEEFVASYDVRKLLKNLVIRSSAGILLTLSLKRN